MTRRRNPQRCAKKWPREWGSTGELISSERTARAEPPFVVVGLSHNMPDHRLGRSHNSCRCCMARGRVAAVEVLLHMSRSTVTGRCMLAEPDTLIDILHNRRSFCIPVAVGHNPAHMRLAHIGVRSTWGPARRRLDNRFRPRHERWQTRYRLLPAPRTQIGALLPKLAMTTARQVQG